MIGDDKRADSAFFLFGKWMNMRRMPHYTSGRDGNGVAKPPQIIEKVGASKPEQPSAQSTAPQPTTAPSKPPKS
ncbi:Hypothetical protein, putative [Bodo saltans]|uniref:Uncharacterized protein n=1 Tax=Bodo saltans TaxID=75058 RepID=A0A0S4J4F4_BODSA|nr:Hypothetical protein, putative [Bodo saltans]|eukprot:CUG86271.1 Hypothetical protein, putative [Bodo saltans]